MRARTSGAKLQLASWQKSASARSAVQSPIPTHINEYIRMLLPGSMRPLRDARERPREAHALGGPAPAARLLRASLGLHLERREQYVLDRQWRGRGSAALGNVCVERVARVGVGGWDAHTGACHRDL